MVPLPVCRWRGEARQGRYVCHSAKFLGAPNVVAAEHCGACHCADHPPQSAAPAALPCVHLSGAAGRGGPFACALHGRCTPAREGAPGGARRCTACPDYLPRAPSGPGSAAMLRRAEAFLAALPDYPARRYRGRGVVLAGGGDRYFAALYITVRALRHVGCRLPIQVWYLGRNDEMPPERQALLAPYGVECVDGDAVRRRQPARRLGGWELKVFATLHSPFDEVLFLDADCYPCRAPDFLFERDDYRALGAIFWSDMAADPRLKWAAFGVAGPRQPGSVESGQYLIDKRSCWRPLNLAWFYNDHSDYYYHYCYGDKHTFEVAWARCGRPFVLWEATPQWQDVAYLHAGPDGLPLFVHRCVDKFRLAPQQYLTPQRHPAPSFHPGLPLERECFGWLGELADRLGGEKAPDRRPPCRWREDRGAAGLACHSPRYVGPPNKVSDDFCRSCGYADHVPAPAPVSPLPKMFCITCRQTPERTAAAARHFQECGLAVELFAGVHGRSFGLRTAHAHGRHFVLPPGHRMLSGHVGLLLSHYMLWEALTRLPYDEVLILEDDAVFGPDFAERFAAAYAELPADWQMVYVGSFGDEGRPTARLTERVAVVRYPLGTHAYLVRRSTLGLLLRTNQEARTHIDVQLAENTLPLLNCYTFLPPLVGQRTVDGTWPSSTDVPDEPGGP
jgi:hypothetical protein